MSAIVIVSVGLSLLFSILFVLNSRRMQVRFAKQQNDLVENTKAFIGRNLHDSIGGMLVVVNQKLSVLQSETAVLEQKQQLQSIIDTVNHGSKELRTIAHHLVPETVSLYGLWQAIEIFGNAIQENGNTAIRISLPYELKIDNDELSLAVYRTVQELVHNAIKHAQATEFFLAVTHKQNVLYIMAENNGVAPDGILKKGVGLQSIQTRVKAFNGTMKINANSSIGWLVNISLKL